MANRVTGPSGDGAHILLVESDHRVRRLLQVHLERAGYFVSSTADGTAALEYVERMRPELAVIDATAAAPGGLALLERLRAISFLPVILLVAQGDEAGRARGLYLGADDFVSKPSDPTALLARVRAVREYRLPGRHGPPWPHASGEITINIALQVAYAWREVRLTATEWRLLTALAANRGIPIPSPELLTSVWGAEYCDQLDFLTTFVQHLRLKIEPDPARPRYILGDPTTGYAFDAE